MSTIWWLDALKRIEKIIRESAFQQKKKKQGLKGNPRLISLWTTGSWMVIINLWTSGQRGPSFVKAVLKCFVVEQVIFSVQLKINECLNFSSTDSEEKWNAVWAAFEDSFLWGEFNIIMFTIMMYQWLSFELCDELLSGLNFIF